MAENDSVSAEEALMEQSGNFMFGGEPQEPVPEPVVTDAGNEAVVEDAVTEPDDDCRYEGRERQDSGTRQGRPQELAD